MGEQHVFMRRRTVSTVSVNRALSVRENTFVQSCPKDFQISVIFYLFLILMWPVVKKIPGTFGYGAGAAVDRRSHASSRAPTTAAQAGTHQGRPASIEKASMICLLLRVSHCLMAFYRETPRPPKVLA